MEMFVLSLTGRYVAPEVFKNEEYDTKVDIFSFALILQEVKTSQSYHYRSSCNNGPLYMLEHFLTVHPELMLSASTIRQSIYMQPHLFLIFDRFYDLF
jgi:serine/threonine protein kinase